MATFPVVITQEEIIDLTMEAMDSNKTDNPLDAKATTSHHGKNKTNHHESKHEKKFIQKDLHFFLQNKGSTLNKKLVTEKNKKKNPRKPNIPLKNPKTILP